MDRMLLTRISVTFLVHQATVRAVMFPLVTSISIFSWLSLAYKNMHIPHSSASSLILEGCSYKEFVFYSSEADSSRQQCGRSLSPTAVIVTAGLTFILLTWMSTDSKQVKSLISNASHIPARQDYGGRLAPVTFSKGVNRNSCLKFK